MQNLKETLAEATTDQILEAIEYACDELDQSAPNQIQMHLIKAMRGALTAYKLTRG